MAQKQRYAEVFGSDYWGKCLDAMGHVDRLTNRRLQRIVHP
jgi:hypothetical protein